MHKRCNDNNWLARESGAEFVSSDVFKLDAKLLPLLNYDGKRCFRIEMRKWDASEREGLIYKNIQVFKHYIAMNRRELKEKANSMNIAQPGNQCELSLNQGTVNVRCPAILDDTCVCEHAHSTKRARQVRKPGNHRHLTNAIMDRNLVKALLGLFIEEKSSDTYCLLNSYVCYHPDKAASIVCIAPGHAQMG